MDRINNMEKSKKKQHIWQNKDYVKILISTFMLYFSFMLLMPLLPLYLKDTFHADKDIIGIVLSGYSLACLLIRPFSGYIVDYFPRKAVLLICNFFFFALFTSYLVAGSITMFAIFRTLHGFPYGVTTVATSTVAVDVLPPNMRARGIGYYGLSNNLAMATGPTIALYLLQITNSYNALFWLSLICSFIGLALEYTIKINPITEDAEPTIEVGDENNQANNIQNRKKRILVIWRKIFLTKGWSESVSIMFFAFAYGVMSTYAAIYGKEELGITKGVGTFFILLAAGLMISRVTGTKALSRGAITNNASKGVVISSLGYIIFASVANQFGFYASALIIGLGNGLMYPAFQTMFINLASHKQRGTANSTILSSWDIGFGIGVLLGGVIAESINYTYALWAACFSYITGTAFYFIYVKSHFIRNKLR